MVWLLLFTSWQTSREWTAHNAKLTVTNCHKSSRSNYSSQNECSYVIDQLARLPQTLILVSQKFAIYNSCNEVAH